MAPNIADGNSLFEFVVRRGYGVKGLVDSGLLRVPSEFIRPPEERINKQDAGAHVAQPIDLSELDGPNHGKIVESLTRAAETVGFFQVVNHGVPVGVLEGLEDAARRFFNQPVEKKAVYLKGVSPSPYVTYGTSYRPEKSKVLEWKDYLSMDYTSDDDAMKHWPEDVRFVFQVPPSRQVIILDPCLPEMDKFIMVKRPPPNKGGLGPTGNRTILQ